MRYLYSIIAIIFWLLIGYFFIKPCIFDHFGCGSTEAVTTTSSIDKKDEATAIMPIANKVTGPLLFNWNKEGAVTGDGWAKLRQDRIDGLKGDEILEITGQYRADEKNTTKFDNLGMARADEIAKLFKPPLTDERIRLKGQLVNGADSDKTSLFKSASFRNLKNSKSIKEIDDKTLIYFPFNSTNKLKSRDVESYLNDVANRVKASGERVILTGHTDNVDSNAFNNRLGQRRANIVRDYLISRGVNKSKIVAETKGETKPVADNGTRAGRAQNRRTELQIIK